MKCRICGNLGKNSVFEFREMMFGTGDRFPYFQCAACGCLQIGEIPRDLSRYYPPEYYSYSATGPAGIKGIRGVLKKKRDTYSFFRKGLIGRMLAGKEMTDATLKSVTGMNLTAKSSILDVGCGNGAFLQELRKIGFRNLLGIDPFLGKNLICGDELRIMKRTIHEVEGKWDLVMFHHSLEHLVDPREVLNAAAALLSAEGVCLIRIPTVSSYAWEHYGADWIQIDPPRHLFLFSVESLKAMAAAAGLALERVVFDSTDFQFWGSEQARMGFPLLSNLSYGLNPAGASFSEMEIAAFKKKAKELNHANRGDQASFYFRRKDGPPASSAVTKE